MTKKFEKCLKDLNIAISDETYEDIQRYENGLNTEETILSILTNEFNLTFLGFKMGERRKIMAYFRRLNNQKNDLEKIESHLNEIGVNFSNKIRQNFKDKSIDCKKYTSLNNNDLIDLGFNCDERRKINREFIKFQSNEKRHVIIELRNIINLKNNFSLENIRNVLSHKLPKPLPTPLYTRIESNNNKKFYDEIIMNAESNIYHELLLPIEFALVDNSYENTDYFALSCVHYLIADVLKISKCLNPQLNETSNQSNVISCYLDKTLVLVGERNERISEGNIETILIKKTARLHPAYYNKVPLMFCFTIDGHLINFFIYKREINHKPILVKIREFDLSKQLNRLELIVFVLNISAILAGLNEERLFPTITMPYILDHMHTKVLPHVTESNSFEYDPLTEELIHFQIISHFDNVQNLLDLYKLLEQGKIVHNQRGYKLSLIIEKCELIIKITSKACLPVQIGLRTKKDSLRAIKHIGETLKSLHELGFVHRNLSWENVVYNEEKKEFCLINFLTAAKCEERIRDKLPNYPLTMKEGAVYKARIDWYLLGKMIEEMDNVGFGIYTMDMRNFTENLIDISKDYNYDIFFNELSKIRD